jgi:hypothetical protein
MDEFPLNEPTPSKRSFTYAEIEQRFGYHRTTEMTAPIYAALRYEFKNLARRVDELCPPGREKSLAFTKLETALDYALRAVANLDPVV